MSVNFFIIFNVDFVVVVDGKGKTEIFGCYPQGICCHNIGIDNVGQLVLFSVVTDGEKIGDEFFLSFNCIEIFEIFDEIRKRVFRTMTECAFCFNISYRTLHNLISGTSYFNISEEYCQENNITLEDIKKCFGNYKY